MNRLSIYNGSMNITETSCTASEHHRNSLNYLSSHSGSAMSYRKSIGGPCYIWRCTSCRYKETQVLLIVDLGFLQSLMDTL